MSDVALLAAHLRGEHSNERLPGCAACERLPPVSVEEPVPVPQNTSYREEWRTAGVRPSTSRKCRCGCGAVVRNRFLPGHDAKLKSRLVKAARSGNGVARRELDELGWTKFI